ncbi:MAG: Spy0128 family protein, partial [Ruminococcus sp.]
FSPGDTVTINGLPVGTTYMVTENVPEGYRCSNNNISGTITSTVSTAEFKNIQSDGQGEITVTKTLDGKNYTGSQFEFVLEGIDASSVTNGVDMSGKAASAKSADKGTVTFKGGDALTFSEVGVYRFKLYEKPFDKIGYTTDYSTYYLQFTVTDNDGELEINSDTVAYYTNDSFSGNSVKSVTFSNTTEKASITVNKTDQSNSTTNTDGTKFALVKVKSANLTEDQINDIVKNDSDKITVQTITNGSTVFRNLPIYRNGEQIYDPSSSSWVASDNYINGTSTTQIYCIFEYSPAGGYSVNNTVNYITFPVNSEYVTTTPGGYTENDDGYYIDDEGNYKYSTEFSYVDGLLLMPDASGSGMNMFLIIGLGILGTGVPAVAGYMLYDRNQRKKRRARYIARH